MGGLQAPALSFSPKLPSGGKSNALPPPLVFQIVSLDHYSAGPIFSSYPTGEYGRFTNKDKEKWIYKTIQSKHPASLSGPHLSFAFSSSVSPFLFFPCHFPLSLIPGIGPQISFLAEAPRCSRV